MKTMTSCALALTVLTMAGGLRAEPCDDPEPNQDPVLRHTERMFKYSAAHAEPIGMTLLFDRLRDDIGSGALSCRAAPVLQVELMEHDPRPVFQPNRATVKVIYSDGHGEGGEAPFYYTFQLGWDGSHRSVAGHSEELLPDELRGLPGMDVAQQWPRPHEEITRLMAAMDDYAQEERLRYFGFGKVGIRVTASGPEYYVKRFADRVRKSGKAKGRTREVVATIPAGGGEVRFQRSKV